MQVICQDTFPMTLFRTHGYQQPVCCEINIVGREVLPVMVSAICLLGVLQVAVHGTSRYEMAGIICTTPR